MHETVIKEDLRPRRLGGGVLMMMGVLLSLPLALLGFSGVMRFDALFMLLPGPFLLCLGLWGAFWRSTPQTRLRISDEAVVIVRQDKTLPLDAIKQIRHHMPMLSKHYRLTFHMAAEDVPLDIIHLTHGGRDIINLIGVRLEKRGKYLVEGRSAVRGALTGVWEVKSGTPFVTEPDRVNLRHGRE